MTLLKTGDIYYNTRLYFRQHIIDSLPNDEHSWREGYRAWLAEQGCEIVRDNPVIPLVVDVLGVAPGYDRFGFKNQADAVIFTLRWT